MDFKKGVKMTKKELIKLFYKVCVLESEYLKNPNTDTAKKYNKYRNELLKNKDFYILTLKSNIPTI